MKKHSNLQNEMMEKFRIEKQKLEKYLLDGEEILLEFQTTYDVIAKDTSKLLGGFAFGLTSLIAAIVLTIYLLYVNLPFLELIPIIGLDVFLTIFTSFLTIKGFTNIKKKINIFQASKKELKNSIDTNLLTNMRWVQKSFSVHSIKEKLVSHQNINWQIQDNLIIIDLPSIYLKYSKDEKTIFQWIFDDTLFIKVYLKNVPQLKNLPINIIPTSSNKFQNAIIKLKQNLILKEKKYNSDSGLIFFYKKEENPF